MLKKFKIILMLALFTFSLSSCIREKIDAPDRPSIDITDPNESESNTTKPEVDIEFKVCLEENHKIYKPKKDEEIIVLWDNLNGEVHQAKIEADGYARVKNLDGDFLVHLANTPKKYTYNPNDSSHFVNANNPDLTIKLHRLLPLRGNGSDLYRPYVYQMRQEGYYRAVANNKTPLYFEFHPIESGTYVFESIVDAYQNEINPIAYYYIGQSTGKFFNRTLNTGGFARPNSFTKNFKMEFSVSDNMIGNDFTWGIVCESINDVYPCNVDFLIVNKEDYEDVVPIVGLMQVAKELDKAQIPSSYDTSGKSLINADGGSGNYYDLNFKLNTVLEGKNFKYKEDEGIYYYYNPTNDKYIAPLCAYISTPNPYYGEGGALASLQMAGNKALTVKTPDGDHLDYSNFIEQQYNSITNEDGLVFVTKELKDFLQMFSNTQRLFMDGNGYIESQYNVMSRGSDQWLFDCCYYI